MPRPSIDRTFVPVLLVLVLQLFTARADILYDNSTGGGTNTYTSALEYGDEIILAQGTSRQMGQFLFEYYGDFVATGDEMAQLRIYKNDGPGKYATPGTLLYDSGPFTIAPGFQTKTINGLNVTLPDDITWTVQFIGLTQTGNDEAGLIVRDPPTAGKSYNDIWMKEANGNWTTYQWPTPGVVANFAARIVSVGVGNSISIHREGKQVVIEWTGLSVLQTAAKSGGPYNDVANIRNRYVVDPTKNPVMFWRLRD